MGQRTNDIATLIDGLIDREGGYSDHPADKGGATRWGVTEAVARLHGYKGDMRAFPRATAVQIYQAIYWIGPNFNLVALRYPDVAELLFDIGVNMGVGVASTLFQRSLNALNSGRAHYADVSLDGRLGPVSMAALDAFRRRRGDDGGAVLWAAIDALRGARYIEISEARPANEAFTYGWFSRVVDMVKTRFGR